MANLDVALRLRLLNGIKPGAQEAKRDLDALRSSALALNGSRGDTAMAQGLGRVAMAGGRADAALRKLAADRAGLSTTGAAAGRLGADLSAVAVSGGRADAALRRLAAERSGLSATSAAAGRLGADLSAVALSGGRADAALRRIAADRAGLSTTGAAAGRLGADLSAVALSGGRADAALRRLAADRADLAATAAAAGRLGTDLSAVAVSSGRTDAALRRLAADRAGLSTTGTAAGRLGADLSAVALSGGRADAALRRLASERSGLSATGAAAVRLGNELNHVAADAVMAVSGLRSLGSERARIAGTAAVAAELARNLERAASVVPRIRLPQAPKIAPWGERLPEREGDRPAAKRPRDRPSLRSRRLLEPDDEMRTRSASAGGEGALVALGRSAVPALGGIYAARGAIRGTVGEAIGFEKAWAEVVKKVNDAPSPEAMLLLQRTVAKTAIELGLPRQGLAELTAEAGAAGIKFVDLERYVRLAAKASIGWDMTPRDAAQKLAEIKSAGGYTIAEMDTLADKINALGDNSAAKEADIVEMFQRAAAPAKAAGVDENTTLSALTALRSGGMQSEIASRFFGAFTGKLATAGAGGKGAKGLTEGFEMLGLTVEAVAAGMKRDAAGTMIDILDRLAKHAEPAKAALKIMGGEWWDEFARFSQSLPEFRKQLDFVKEGKNFGGSLGGNLNVHLATTANHLERLKALTGDVGDRMGRWALPGINSAVEGAIRQVDELEQRRALQREASGGGSDLIDFAKRRSMLSLFDPNTEQTTVDRMITDGAKWLYRKGLDATIGQLPTTDPARASSRSTLQKAADAAEAAKKAREQADLLEVRAKGADSDETRQGLLDQARQARERAVAQDTESRDLTRGAGPAAARDLTDVEYGEAYARKSVETRRKIRDLETALAASKQPNVRIPGTGIITSRDSAAAELSSLREQMQAMTATDVVAGPAPRPSFDLSGPATQTDLRIGRPAGGAGAFPLAADLAQAELALPPLIAGVGEAADKVARMRLADRFDSADGVEARPDMRSGMEALAARRRAEAAPSSKPPAAFDVSGPVARAPASVGDGARAFPLAADLAKARFDPQPLIIGMREAGEEAKRLQSTLSQDLSAPARQSMETYNGALKVGADQALATVTAAVARMTSALSFTATPTIAPRLVAPPAGGGPAVTPSGAPAPASRAPRLQSAALRRGGGGNTFTGPIHVHGVRDVASLHREISRTADRRARDSRDGALHDTGSEVA